MEKKKKKERKAVGDACGGWMNGIGEEGGPAAIGRT